MRKTTPKPMSDSPATGRKKNALITQKRAIVAVAVLIVLLTAAFVISGIIADIYTYPDQDGQTYTIKKSRGDYALFKDGEMCDMGFDNGITYYVTEMGTQVIIDPDTGAYSIYAVVDVEDTEQLNYFGTTARVMMFKQLTYDESSTRDQTRIIKSIEIHNQHSSFTLARDVNNRFYVKEYPTAVLVEDSFAQLASGCGYTLTLQRLENPKRLPDGSIDYAEYGLAAEVRTTVDESGSGNTVTYDYVPTRYTVTTMTDDAYHVTIGDATVSEGGYYARYADRDTVYILSSTNLAAGALRPIEELVTPLLVYPMSSTNYFYVTDFTYRSSFDHDAITRELYAAILGEDALASLPAAGETLTEEEEELVAQLEADYEAAVSAMSDEEYARIYEEIVKRNSSLVTQFSYDASDRKNTMNASRPFVMSSEYMAGYLPHADNLSAMLQSISGMSFERVVALAPSSEQLTAYGLDEYAHEISFIYNEKLAVKQEDGSTKEEIRQYFSYFRVSEKTEDGLYYAYAPTYDMIVCFTEDQAPYLEWEEIDWYDRLYFQMYLAFVKTIKLEGAGFSKPITFTLDNSKSDQSEQINTDQLEVYADGKRIDYDIYYTKMSGDIIKENAAYNFHRLFKAFQLASLSGVADLTDAQLSSINNTPDSECLLKFTVISDDGKGNTEYTVYRFYAYTERKAYMTIEVLDSPNAASNPARAQGKFYVSRSFCEKLTADVHRFLDGVEIVVESKN